jgi:hypothetical protein
MKNNTFTIDDIHRIRYENYEKTKNFSAEELLAHTKQEAAAGLKRLAELQQKKSQAS